MAESMHHDCFFQMRNLRIDLKKSWPEIIIKEVGEVRYLLFIKDNKKDTCVDLNKVGDMCGVILFDPKKEPELIDMMNGGTALEYYFHQ